MGCVYLSKNKENGKCYIGRTVNNLAQRKREHKSSARNGNTSVFWRAIRKYGWKSFVWSVLFESNDFDKLSKMEIKYIKKFQSRTPSGYNVTEGGEGTSGWKHSEESIEKMSEAHRGCVPSEETRQKQRESMLITLENKVTTKAEHERRSNSQKGDKHSEETKAKIRQANLGKRASQATREKMSQSGKKRHRLNGGHSSETKEKIGKAHKGNKHSEETKRKISKANKGNVCSAEHRKKLSEAAKRDWAKRKRDMCQRDE